MSFKVKINGQHYEAVGLQVFFDGAPLFEVEDYARRAVDAHMKPHMAARPYGLEAITVCCVCCKPIEPQNQAEYDACENPGVHLGECWNQYKRALL
jgi:hypothetical protein